MTTKFAWVENGAVRDVCEGDPTELYHPDIAKLYTKVVPAGTIHGATEDNGVWKNPEPPKPQPPSKKELLKRETLAIVEAKFEAATKDKPDAQLPTADQILKGA